MKSDFSENLEKLEWPPFLEILKREVSTEAGEEKAKRFSPTFSFKEAVKRQTRLRELKAFTESTGISRLAPVAKITPLVEKALKGGLLGPEELHQIKKTLEVAEGCSSLSFFPSLDPMKALYQELSFCLDPSGRDLADRASPELRAVRKRARHFFERLHEVMESLLRKYAREGLLREEHIFQRKGRLVLPVRSEHRHRVAGILHDVSQSGATVFIEPSEAVSLSNELEAARLEEERIKREILKRLSILVGKFGEDLLEIEKAIAEVDVGLSALRLAQRYGGRFPVLKEAGDLKLLSAVHPFFRLRDEEAVANDFKLSSQKPILVVSGPNFGGKTVALKTVGMCVLMAQAGLPIPAAEGSEIPVFSAVLVDLGDDQGIVSHESSFSAHLRTLQEILDKACLGTLALLDEPGRGTDPREGAALAVAVLDVLEDSGALVITTTHYPEIKRWALARKKVVPASMEFDDLQGVPTYRLIYGALSASHGLGLARRFLPREVIQRAESYLSGEDEGEALMKTLRVLEKRLREREKLLERERQTLLQEKERLEKERSRLKEELAREKERLREEVERRFQEVKGRFWELVSQVPRRGKREIRKEISVLREEIREPIETQEEMPGELQPGQKVFLKDFQKEGEVLRDLGEEVEVRLGVFRVAVSKKSIKVLSDVRSKPRVRIAVPAEKELPDTLHLLGLRTDEALSLLERYLNRAILAGRKEVRIIHGLGTGRLQQAVRNYLREHEAVEAIRSGAPFEGGEGVTIVTLTPKREAA